MLFDRHVHYKCETHQTFVKVNDLKLEKKTEEKSREESRGEQRKWDERRGEERGGGETRHERK